MTRRRGATAEPSAAELATQRKRDADAVQLALAGASYEQIAQQLQYADRSGAWRAVRRALNRHEADDVMALRDQEVARLDRLQTAVWSKALQGDLQAIEQVRRLIDLRVRLLGLSHADGVAERQLQLAEREGQALVRLLETFAGALGLDAAAPDVRAAARQALTAIDGEVVA